MGIHKRTTAAATTGALALAAALGGSATSSASSLSNVGGQSLDAVAAAIGTTAAALDAEWIAGSESKAKSRKRSTSRQIQAFYSRGFRAPQSRNRSAMRRYLSKVQPRYDLQSFVFFGSLSNGRGQVNSFSTLTQTQQLDSPPTVGSLSFNAARNPGTVIAGLQGTPGQDVNFTIDKRPWNLAVTPKPVGSGSEYVRAEVVKGQVGQKGAVYRLFGSVPGIDSAGQPVLLKTVVRAKDTTGMAQWGYGPSGFFPQWLYPTQRRKIMNSYGGSVKRYLEDTGAQMRGQGSYYYSSPLLKVQRYTVYQDGKVVTRGRKGHLWLDQVNQSFDKRARKIVGNGVNWIEFSVQLPGSRQALKIGDVRQRSVGSLPYAMLIRRDGERVRSGLLASARTWDLADIRIKPIRSSQWTSPKSGKTYYLSYDVILAGNKANGTGRLRVTARTPDQEISLSSRTVYEGLFTVKGTLLGKRVGGQAWGEIQPK